MNPVQAGKSVLLVDDCNGTRHFCAMILEQAHFDVIETASAVEALDLLRQKSFDVLVIDYCMPNMNGGELIRKLAQSGLLFRRIILHTGLEASNSAVASVLKDMGKKIPLFYCQKSARHDELIMLLEAA